MALKLVSIFYLLNSNIINVVNTSKDINSSTQNNDLRNWTYYKNFVQIKNLYGLDNVKNFSKRSTNKSHRQPKQRRMDVSSSIWSNVKHMYGPSNKNKFNGDKQGTDRIIQDLKITQHREYFTPKDTFPIYHDSVYHQTKNRRNYDDFSYYKSSVMYPAAEKHSSYKDMEENMDKHKLRKNALQRYQAPKIHETNLRDYPRKDKIKKYLKEDDYYDPENDDYFWGIDDYDSDEDGDWEKETTRNKFDVRTKYGGNKFKKRHNRLKYNIVVEDNLIDRYIGPLIGSHVVTTSIHPWIFPYFFGIAEPYISFITFLITAMIELFGIGVGSAGLLVGLRAFRITDDDSSGTSTSTSGTKS